MNSALKIDLITGEAAPIQIDGDAGVLRHFSNDVRGKTLLEISDGQFLREWRSVDPKSEKIAIVDAYDGQTLNRLDIPITADEYQRSLGAPEQIGVTL
jgi:hypothetical protein